MVYGPTADPRQCSPVLPEIRNALEVRHIIGGTVLEIVVFLITDDIIFYEYSTLTRNSGRECSSGTSVRVTNMTTNEYDDKCKFV